MQPALAIADWLSPSRNDAIVAWRGAQPLRLSMLRRQVQSLCWQLQARAEARWALCFDDSYQFTVALLAALYAGKTPVIPGHSRPALLQEQSSYFDGLLTDLPVAAFCPLLRLDEGVSPEKQLASAAPPASQHPDGEAPGQCRDTLPQLPDDAQLVLFTSGSSGEPRQIVKPVRCLDSEAQWLAALWGERLQGCCVVASVSHQHLYGLTFRIVLPMALGLPFASQPVLYSEQLSALTTERHYAFISSPAFLRRLDFSLTPPCCRLIVSAGGVLAADAAAAAADWFHQPVDEIYGSTETGVLAWRCCHRDAPQWQPFAGVTFSCDSQQRWWAQSALIAPPEGLPLDDRLVFSAAGDFQLCGRQDRVVKIEDKRISLSEIERRLLAMPEISDAAALSISRYGRSSIGVVVVLAAGLQADQLARLKPIWKRELQRWLEPVAVPRFWRVVEAMPDNSQSKRDWRQIQELFYVAG